MTSEQKIEYAKKMLATGGYNKVKLSHGQCVRLIKDIKGWTANECLVNTGIYIQD